MLSFWKIGLGLFLQDDKELKILGSGEVSSGGEVLTIYIGSMWHFVFYLLVIV